MLLLQKESLQYVKYVQAFLCSKRLPSIKVTSSGGQKMLADEIQTRATQKHILEGKLSNFPITYNNGDSNNNIVKVFIIVV